MKSMVKSGSMVKQGELKKREGARTGKQILIRCLATQRQPFRANDCGKLIRNQQTAL